MIIEEWFSGLKESLSEYFLITVSLCYFFLLYFSWKLIRGNFSGDNENISYLDSKVIKINKYVIYSKIDEVMLEKEKLEKQLSFYKNNIDMDSKTEIKIRIDQINQIIMILRKDL